MKQGIFVIIAFFALILFSPALAQTNQATGLTIGEIFIIGNKKTKSPIIKRELGVLPGDQFDSIGLVQYLDSARIRIYNTNLFNSVEVQPLFSGHGIADVFVKVVERWYFYPSPFLRIADRNLMDWIINRGGDIERFNAGLRLDQYNFRGRNEKVKFVGQIGFEQRFALGYIIPYIEKTQRHGLGFELIYNEREKMPFITDNHLPTFINYEQINRRSWIAGIQHSYRPDFYSTHLTSLTYNQTSVSDTIVSLNPNFLGDSATDQQFFRLAYSFVNDLRNNRNYPTHGHLFRATVEQRGLGIFGDLGIFSITATYNKYIQLNRNFFYATGITGFFSTPRDQPYFNYRGLGYDDIYARGFELDVVEGSKYFLMKNSFRKMIFSGRKDMSRFMPIAQFNDFKLAMYGKLIADFAYVENYPNYQISSRLTDQLLYSLGGGIDFVTIYDLVLRLEYTYTSENRTNFAINILADIN